MVKEWKLAVNCFIENEKGWFWHNIFSESERCLLLRLCKLKLTAIYSFNVMFCSSKIQLSAAISSEYRAEFCYRQIIATTIKLPFVSINSDSILFSICREISISRHKYELLYRLKIESMFKNTQTTEGWVLREKMPLKTV